MAQMTRNASFGPVLFVVAPCRYICSFNLPVTVTLLIDIKNANIKKKTLINGPNDTKRVIWARSSRRSLP